MTTPDLCPLEPTPDDMRLAYKALKVVIGERDRIWAALEQVVEALVAAVALLDENVQSITDGYTILQPDDPEFGHVTDEGREMIAPYEAAISLSRAALAKVTASPPIYRDVGAEFLRAVVVEPAVHRSPLDKEYRELSGEEKEFAKRSTLDTAMSDACPHCRADLTGEPIPEELRHQYGGATHFSRRIDINYLDDGRNHSDVHRCPDCDGTWPAEGQRK